jgi:hypothetical protein
MGIQGEAKMIDYMQLWRFLDEPWETVPPPETMTPEEMDLAGGGFPFVNM